MRAFTPNAVYYVRSTSDPSLFHLVAANVRGFLECDCRASQFRRDRPCKHCRVVAAGDVKPAQPKRPTPPPRTVAVSESFRDTLAAMQV